MENNYGEMFKNIRLSQNLTLKEVSENIVSISYLSKFEKGQTNITLPTFLKLLTKLNIKLEEFIYYCDDKTNDFNYFSLVFTEAYRHSDVEKLNILKEQQHVLFSSTKNNLYKINSIMIAASLFDLNPGYIISKEDLTTISDYLIQIPYWSSYNIFVLSNTNAIIPIELHKMLVTEIIKLNELKQLGPISPRELLFLYHNSSITFLRNDELEMATKIHTKAKTLLHSGFLFEKNRNIFIEGLIKISTGDTYNGLNIANKTIDIIKYFEPNLANQYVMEIKRHLNIFSL